MILVAGGETDPNVLAVWQRISERRLEGYPLLVGATRHPIISWDVENDELWIDGEVRRPSAVFIRHDVFSLLDGRNDPDAAYRAHAWFAVVIGWAVAHPEVRLLNRQRALWMTNKPRMLHEAKKSGLPIPRTLISNDVDCIERVANGVESVAKSVIDGSYCERLSDVLGRTETHEGRMAAPATIQAELVAPEVRVYAIAGRFHAFSVESEALDYRTDSGVEVTPLNLDMLPSHILPGLTALMDSLGASFGAADFKTCERTGELLFLELNSAPMFSVFDKTCDGALINSIVDFLAGQA